MNNYLVLGKFKIKYSTIFILLLILYAFIYEYNIILSTRPMSIHAWRSCVSASIAQGYYHDGSLLPSKVGAQIADDRTSDKVVIEFPLFYYIVSIFYRIFGMHEFIFRLLNVILGFIGLMYLFKTTRLLLKDNSILTFFIALILFISPLYVFYLNNFLPETTSLSISLIGLFFFFRFYQKTNYKDFLLSMILFALAGLLKVTSLIIFFGIFASYLLEVLLKVKLKITEKVFPNPLKYFLSFIGVLALISVWYLYARTYSDTHDAILSAIEVRPFWDCSIELRQTIWAQLKYRFITGNYYSPVFLYFTLALLFLNVLFIKKYNRLLNIILFVSIIEAFVFNTLFFFSIGRCDYYQLNNVIIPVLIYLNFALFLKGNYNKVYRSVYLKVFFVLFGIFLLNECRFFMQKHRYGGYWYDSTISVVEKYGYLTPYLRSIGIERDDLVYVTPDVSVNISLYLMDQKGFTDYGLYKSRKKSLEKVIPLGVQYFIVGDSTIYNEEGLAPFIQNKVGELNGVDIYKVAN